MNLINVICSNCGHLISIPESVKHATCNGCQTPLSIQQTDSSTYTEAMPLGRLSDLDVVAVNKVNNEDIYSKIEMLDNAWKIELEHFQLEGGRPKQKYKIALLIFVTLILVAAIVTIRNVDLLVLRPGLGLLFWVFLLILILGALAYKVIKGSIRLKTFRYKKKDYEEKRTRFVLQLKK